MSENETLDAAMDMARKLAGQVAQWSDRCAELELEIGEACDLIGEGGDNTLFGRCESMLTENASLRAGLEKVREIADLAARQEDGGFDSKAIFLNILVVLAGVDHG